jgi:hypothetical protein
MVAQVRYSGAGRSRGRVAPCEPEARVPWLSLKTEVV